ncbi:uncharacterized protein LOC125548536 [Triticum urartu]|uniref:DUF1639 family protein n=3 Tax=Triticum TaxID=4564 RepID=A0A9R0RN45_TRITD|nr:uncharacterized protein LOC123058491 [Triticum aestivum]XP_048568072.1 uncharacterized protein LOC125548535 [Triticum urartu]XP_048568073.1 uncharacterized protein LOC125548536 [Triticum urartu]VAH63103.1 unnamed protein product [Triticum turgidum subsp. durum]
MAATADPTAKTPATQPHRLKPWGPPQPPRGHCVPSLSSVSGGAGAIRDRRRSSTSHRRGGADAVDEGPYDDGLEDLRAKLMGHVHEAADRLRLPPATPQRSPEPEPPAAPLPPPPQDAAAVVAASMPWTLRERKRRPSGRGSTGAASSATPWSTTPAAMARHDGMRGPFAVALDAEEIEEDVYALTGARPRRRPRKRARVVQRQLDSLFPGLWLTEITADAYRVPDDQ